jgi:beta-lactamase superfamily II metal-dependent hydrolase
LGANFSQAATRPGLIKLTFIDVGQGDSILIQNNSDFEILVDGGRKSAGENVLAYLRENGVDELEVMIATHADSDHIGGLIKVIEAKDILIGSVYYNGYPGDTHTWAEFSEAVAAAGLSLIPAQFPQTYSWGEINFEVLNPLSDLVEPEQNDVSIVLTVGYEQINALLTADIDADVESMLLSRSSDLEAEVLKIPHHGSKLSSSTLFLEEVNPDEAIISVGSNQYGHPAPEIISRLMNLGANVWRTDYLGTDQMISDDYKYSMIPRLSYLPLLFRFPIPAP